MVSWASFWGSAFSNCMTSAFPALFRIAHKCIKIDHGAPKNTRPEANQPGAFLRLSVFPVVISSRNEQSEDGHSKWKARAAKLLLWPFSLSRECAYGALRGGRAPATATGDSLRSSYTNRAGAKRLCGRSHQALRWAGMRVDGVPPPEKPRPCLLGSALHDGSSGPRG